MLRYFEHKLYLRKLAWGFVGILSSIEVNLPARRMVGNLVARKIDLAPKIAAAAVSPAANAAHALSSASLVRVDPAAAAAAPAPPPPPVARTAPPAPPGPRLHRREARDSPSSLHSERRVRMYRGRRIDE